MTSVDGLIAQLISGDDPVANEAVKELSPHGEKAVEKLIDLLKEDDKDIRWWAIRALAEIDSPIARIQIIKHLVDKDLAVQHCAAVALRINPTEESIISLIPLLENKDHLLSQLSSDALVANGEKSTLLLIEVLKDGSQKAQIQAVRALASIGDKRSISALFGLLDSDSAILEYWAKEGLEKMGIGMTFFNP